jgi:hypothetical protein
VHAAVEPHSRLRRAAGLGRHAALPDPGADTLGFSLRASPTTIHPGARPCSPTTRS